MTGAEDDIRALFAAYATGFDDADAESVAALFAYPATIWQLGEGHVFDDAGELTDNIDALIDVFDEAGIVLTTPEVKAIHVAGEAAFAHVLWRQEDPDGEALHQFTCQYMLLHREGAWRIATIVNEEADN